ncbi:MAG: UPF0280 family protein [Deltaproteobacteria bacterium]|nr:MAG: UPF0280 family protein [Deltaproteobacteria bacterium]
MLVKEKKKNKWGFGKKFYRKITRPEGLVSFSVQVKQTDLWISAKKELKREAELFVLSARNQIEGYIERYPEFSKTLLPWPEDLTAPPVVKDMIRAGRNAGIGPMSAVAGAIAEYVGKKLLRFSDEVIVENGGDVFLCLNRSVTVGILFGRECQIGVKIKEDMMPAGVCSSSAKIGHSLSFGRADLVTVFSHSASVADSAATAIANRIKKAADIKELNRWADQIKGIFGIVAIFNKNISLWGDLEICAL